MAEIWAITLIQNETLDSVRTVGYYHLKSAAHQCLIADCSDISQNGFYQYAVLEAITEGPYPVADAESSAFYEYNIALSKYDRIDPPTFIDYDAYHPMLYACIG